MRCVWPLSRKWQKLSIAVTHDRFGLTFTATLMRLSEKKFHLSTVRGGGFFAGNSSLRMRTAAVKKAELCHSNPINGKCWQYFFRRSLSMYGANDHCAGQFQASSGTKNSSLIVNERNRIVRAWLERRWNRKSICVDYDCRYPIGVQIKMAGIDLSGIKCSSLVNSWWLSNWMDVCEALHAPIIQNDCSQFTDYKWLVECVIIGRIFGKEANNKEPE